jgi:crotonobetainyl-CoA:carnitine CoA-transferase CaiB-like acyl-CoA transferase
MSRMLVGIKVLDLSRLLPGPYCTQMLADLGAEVIKVERPGEGDPARNLRTRINGHGSTFVMTNRNKKSMTLNLKTREGAEIFRRLAGNADVIVESFRPGVVDRLGISYQALRRDNRKLIYLSLTGYGQDGPYAQRAGHDINYVAAAGLAALTGPRGGVPVPMGLQVADIAGGALLGAFAIMSALYHREHTGRGQYIDVAMLDGVLSVAQSLFGEYLATDKDPAPGSMRLSGGYPPYGVYETKDKQYFSLAALEPQFWETFCKKAGREDLIALHDSGWDIDRDKLEAELRQLFKSKTRDEWSALLADEDTCAAPVLTMAELINHPQLKHRGMIISGPHPDPDQPPIPQIAFPIKFSEVEAIPAGPSPRLGQHSTEILKSVGYSKIEISEFKKKGVI